MTREEQISAWLDNALPDAERMAFEADMAADPILAAQVEKLSANDESMRAAFAMRANDDVPDHLLTMLRTEPAPVSVNAPRNNLRPAWLTWGGGAIAAAFALALVLTPRPSGNERQIADNIGLIASLETRTLATGAQLTPRLSFPSTEGGHCRQFVLVEKGNAQSGLACHADGRWSVRALAPITETQGGAGYATAGGRSAPAIDAASDKLRSGDPLDAKAEAELIAKKWKGAGE